MNNKKRLFKPLIALVCALTFVLGAVALVACGGTDAKSAISFAKSEITTYVGDSVTLEVTTTPADAEVSFTSSDPKVATVSRRGIVSAVANGTATITAKLESGASATCEITVLTRTITISQKTATVDLTETTELQLTATSSDGGDIKWESSDTSIATVGRDTGKVTFGRATAKEATVEIFARCGAAYDVCVITVVDPSIPDDYYVLTKETNANVVANPGTWFYHADGAESTNYRFSLAPAYGDAKLTAELDIFPSLSDGKYFRFRYQPDYPAEGAVDEETGETLKGTKYTLKFTIKVNMDCTVGYGTAGAFGGVSNATLKADTEKAVVFVGTVNTSEPFHINVNKVTGEVPEKVSFEITNIVVKEYEPGDEVGQDVPDIPNYELPAEYTLVRGSATETCEDAGRWYWLIDPQSGEEELASATYNNGTITLALHATKLGVNTHHLRYQPRLAIGTRVEYTFTVNVNKAATINFGLNSDQGKNGNEYDLTENENGGTATIKCVCVVTKNRPFVIEVKAEDTESPITMIVTDFSVAEKPLEDFTVTFDTKGGEAIAAATVKEESSLATLPTPTRDGGYTFLGWFESEEYEGTALVAPYTPKGNVTLYAKWADPEEVIYTVSYNTHGGNEIDNQTVMGGGSVTLVTPTREGYVFDGWYEDTDYSGEKLTGETYTPTATVTLHAKWLAQYTVTLNKNHYNSKGESTEVKTAIEGSAVTLSTLTRKGFTFDGWYAAADFSGEAVTGEYIPTANVTLNAKWTAVAEYDLADGGYGDAANNRDVWYYKAHGSQSSVTISGAKYENGVVTLTATGAKNLEKENKSDNLVQLRYMPNVSTGYAFTLSLTYQASVDGRVWIGRNDVGEWHDVTANEPITLTYSTKAEINPGDSQFRIILIGFYPTTTGDVTITAKNIEYGATPKPEIPNEYRLENTDKATAVANPGKWYCNYPGASTVPGRECDEANTKYDNGVITYAFTNIVSADGANGYQLRYQPDLAVGTKVTITFKFKLSVAGRILYGRDYKNSNDSHGGAPMAADEELQLTWTGTIDASNPFMIQIKGVEDGPVVLTVWDFTVTEVAA